MEEGQIKTDMTGTPQGGLIKLPQYRQKIKAMNQWLKAVRNAVKLKVWWKMLRPNW